MALSPTRRRFLHALLICALAVGLAVTLWSGFDLVHALRPASIESMASLPPRQSIPSMRLHELLGWTAGAAMALHVALRWRWLLSVLRRLPALRGEARTNLVLGTALTLVVGLEVASGALLAPGNAWQGLHHLSSKLVIALAVWHVARHWSWLKLRLAPWAARRGSENRVPGVRPAR